MNRGNFFKSLVTLLAAPSIISEIDWDKKQECVWDAKRVAEEFNKTGNVYYDAPPIHRVMSDEFPKWHIERNIPIIW